MAVFKGLKSAKQFCQKAYKKNMLVSNTLTTIALLGAGDTLTQYIEIKLLDSSKDLKKQFSEIAATNMEFSSTNKMLIPLSNKSICTVKQLNQCYEEENCFMAKYDWKRTGKNKYYTNLL
jgi:hypothetical protein